MSKRSTLLKELLRQRHWQTYATFCRQYDAAARRTDTTLVGKWPSRGQFARWLSGDLKGLPHPDHCRVLESMFAGFSAHQLFSPAGMPGGPVPTTVPSTQPAAQQSTQQNGENVAPSSIPGYAPFPGLPHQSPHQHHTENHPAHHAVQPYLTQPTIPALPHQTAQQTAAQHGAQARADAERGLTVGPQHLPTGHGPNSFPAAGRSRMPAPGGPAIGSGNSLQEEVAMATEESAVFVRGARSGVDHDVLDQLAADVRQLAIDYLAKPPLTIFRPIFRLRHEVFEMLDERQRPTLLPPMYAVAGRLCALLAHASADLGHSYSAETHTRTAWLCADLADDDSLRAYVRWVQANVLFWNGDYRRAAQVAQNGQRFATKGSNLLRLASQEARAWAACGEPSEVERALAVATRAREVGVNDDQPGVFRFDPGKAAYYASEVRLALGGEANNRQAVTCAEEALRLFDEGPEAHRSPEFEAAARLDLANAYLALADLDGAAEQLRIVLRLPAESRTQPIVGRVTAAGRSLDDPKFTHSALAADLKEEIALFRAYPAQRDLPEVLD